MDKKTDQLFRNILKYNADRKYFGDWTPKQIHNAYHNNMFNEINRTSTLSTGLISIDDICDSLWNEMSYNPARFGETSPFLFDGENSIEAFCNKYATYRETKRPITTTEEQIQEQNKILFARISNDLKIFLGLMKEYDAYFQDKQSTETSSMKIGLQHYSQHSNLGYKILSCLAHCVKEICMQNLEDFGYKKRIFRAKIILVAQTRHSNLIRPVKLPNYRQIQYIQDRIKYLEEKQKALSEQIKDKEYEIEDINSRINTYEEEFAEAPVDTSSDESKCNQRKQELESLENQAIQNTNMITSLRRKLILENNR